MYVEITLIVVAIVFGLVGTAVTGIVKRASTKLDKLDDISITLARMDERDQHQAESIVTLRKRTHDHSNILQHHESRITILEVNKK